MNKARVIAFYLPQFHPIPENDEIWGKGFTEWTNVAKARPQFLGHYQPQLPADLGFYDLRLSETRIEQAKMAKEYGVEGFCYWHYWFGNGKRVLERPFNEVLESGEPDFPFCLAWANHNWSTKTWTSVKHFTRDALFIEQCYPGDDDYISHFYALLPAFKDKRYIQVDEKPLFVVFDPEGLPDARHFIELWNDLARKNGLKGIHFVGRTSSMGKMSFDSNKSHIAERYKHIMNLGFNAINSDMQRYAEVSAAGILRRAINSALRKTIGNFYPVTYPYKKVMKYFYTEEEAWENVYPQILPRLDRTPRSGKDARIYINSSPELFAESIDKALSLVNKKKKDHRIIFLQAWNEWGEGNYMEPDIRYGRKYLEALKEKIVQ